MLELIEKGILPITALAAIILFGLRELIDWLRKRGTTALKLKSLKRLLAQECEQNQWALEWLKKASSEIIVALQTAQKVYIEECPSGEHRLVFEAPDGSYSSSPIPRVYDQILRDNLFDAASIDEDFFERMTESVGAVEEIRHLIRGLFQHTHDGQLHLDAWANYAHGEVGDISAELGELYYLCKGVRKIPARIRSSS